MIELKFGPPTTVQTPWGTKINEVALPTPQFWMAWRKAEDSLRELGIYVRKIDGQWHVGRMRNSVDLEPAQEVSGYMLATSKHLKDYQSPHAGSLCASIIKNGHALDGSDTGTGKTYTALAVAREFKLSPAIVCTPRAIKKWITLCEQFRLEPTFVVNWEFAKTGKLSHAYVRKEKGKVVDFAWRLKKERTLLVLDEAHKAKGQYTIASQMLISAKDCLTLALSASFATSPIDMRALGYVLGLHNLTNFKDWLLNYATFPVRVGNGDNARLECINPNDEMSKMHRIIFPAHGSRMRKLLIPGFPKTQILAELHEVEGSKKQNDEYDRVMNEIEKLHSTGNKMQGQVLELRYRQLAENIKVKLLYDLAQEDIENGMSCAIFLNFTPTLLALAELFKTDCIVAGQSVRTLKQNNKAIQDFQSDKSRIIILNSQAGGESIDLHDVRGEYPRTALIAPTYDAIVLKQIFGRVNRAEGKSTSIQRLIYASGTIEEKVCDRVNQKLANIDTLNDGDLADLNFLKIG